MMPNTIGGEQRKLDDTTQFFGFTGRSARNRMRAWENGDEIPPLKHREAFIQYLLEKLSLREDQEVFQQVWQDLCHVWRWPDMSASEKRRFFQRDNSSLTRKIIYSLPDSNEAIRKDLSVWPIIQPDRVDVADSTIIIGDTNSGAAARVPTRKLANCGVEFEVKILRCGNDPWIGVMIRGFDTAFGNVVVQHIDFGYLIYLRANGALELYCQEVREVAKEKPTEDATKEWVKIKVEMIDSRIQVIANNSTLIDRNDSTFGGAGYIYLQAFRSVAGIRKLAVYEIS